MLWDLRSGKIVQTLETKSPVTSAEVSQDGRHITTADGSNVKFWDANHVESASLEPKHGNKFIAGGEDMWVHVFDFHTGEEIVRLQQGSPCMVLSTVCSSPGGESYASGSEDGTIRIWQTGSGNHEKNDSVPPNGPSGRVKASCGC
ncbi:hypothetical protein POUND7_003602 [Theobroma cacao]